MAGTEQANRSVFLLLCNATGKRVAHAQWIANQWFEIVIKCDGISDLLLKSKGAEIWQHFTLMMASFILYILLSSMLKGVK